MRGTDIVTIIISVALLAFILAYIIPKILEAQDVAPEVPPVETGSWTGHIISGLVYSEASPKSATTPILSFVSPKDNCVLADELVMAMQSSINATRTTCNCTALLEEDELRLCPDSESCSMSAGTVDIINNDFDEEGSRLKGVLEERAYTITVTASTEFEWLCIRIDPEGE